MYWRIILNIDTKIKYLKVESKIYEVTELSFRKMKITAAEINTPAADLPEEEVFDYRLLNDYRIKLINGKDKAEVIDFADWKSKNW